MIRRNAVYTINNGFEFEISEYNNDNYLLIYRGKNCPNSSFQQVGDVYTNIINKNKVFNSFRVSTHALYKGHEFRVERTVGDSYQIATYDYDTYIALIDDLKMIERGYYLRMAHKTEIAGMWELRTPSSYSALPMPEGMERIKEIDFK